METQTPPVPPPPPDYFVLKGGHILGPFDIEELRAAIREERIDLSDFVQTGGIPIWRPLARVLGLDGSTAYGAVAPDWRSILTWAWLRLRYNLDEQSLAAGLLCFGIALVMLLLARFSFLIWLPWLIPAAVAAVALIRRRQVLTGLALLLAVCAVPIAEAQYHLGSRSTARGTNSKSMVNRAVPIDRGIESGAEPEAARASPHSPLALETAPAPVGSLSSATAPSPSELTPVAPPPTQDETKPNSAPPLPLVAVANPSAVAVQPTATLPSPTTPASAAATAIETTLPPGPTRPVIPTSPPKPAEVTNVPITASGDFVQDHRDSLIVIRDREGAGSGFLCKKGERVWLFTNNHVAAGMRQPTFSQLNGTRINVGTAESAAGYDAMRFTLTDSPALPLETVTDLEGLARIGDEVVVLGNSGGGGVVTSIKGKLVGIGPDRIEVSAEFIPGNSGSPIVHVPSGKVIGIATYISRRYEEFSAEGQPPQGPATGKLPGLRGQGTVVTRRFGYRLDNVPRWEPVNWQAFQNEAEQLRQISSLTEDIFNFLGSLRASGSPQFGTDTLRRPAQQWFDTVRKPRLSEVDKMNATHSFLNSLRYMVRADVSAAESRLRYNYFRERLAEEKTVRDKLYQAFDSEARRLASPSSR